MNNDALEHSILGYAAKYRERYGVKLFAFAIEGNHIQFPALFPGANRAHFMRDLNSSIARAVPRYQCEYDGGRLFGRRYSVEYLPGNDDIENQFFYTVLQPVQDGLVDDIREYESYNCFEDAIRGVTRTFKVIRWKEYNDARRWNPDVAVEAFTEYFDLTYDRLPGYEDLSQDEYVALMRQKLARRTVEILKDRGNKPALGAAALKHIRPGARPKKTKQGSITDHRPRVLSVSHARRHAGKAWYFDIYYKFRDASKAYRSGNVDYEFPEGTYKPPAFTIAYSKEIVLHHLS